MDKEQLRSQLSRAPIIEVTRAGLRQAAVLVPVYPDRSGLSVCFLRRPEAMRSHAGQIAFPGGGYEDQDGDLGQTALRETHEELGIEPTRVELLGRIDETWTPSGYRMSPYVGWLQEPPELRPNPREVSEVLQVEVAQLMEPRLLRHEYWDHQGQSYRMVFFDIPGGPIWGATARILYRFLQSGFDWRQDDDEPWERPHPS